MTDEDRATVATIISALVECLDDNTGGLRRRLRARLWALAETEQPTDADTRAALSAVAAGLQGRDDA